MIRINLLKNRGTSVTGVGGETNFTYMGEDEYGAGGLSKDAIVKIFLIVIWTILLMVYEAHNVGQIKEKQAKLNQQLNSIQSKKSAVVQELKSMGTIEAEAKALENKLELMRKLSKTRLRELKALDFVQSATPNRLWLTSVNYDRDSFIINGQSISDNDLNQLVERLEASAYFEDVIVMSSIEKQTNSGTVKEFRVSSRLEELQ